MAQITRKRRSRASARSGRTQNESKPVLRISGPQLVRALRGGQPGNRNAQKSLVWLDEYDLTTPEGVRGFLGEVIKHTWTGDLGTRQASALNGSVRLMLEHEILPLLEARIKALEEAKGAKPN
jgi:hypothetical protein